MKKIESIIKPDEGQLLPRKVLYLGTPHTETSIYLRLTRERNYAARYWPALYPKDLEPYEGNLCPRIQGLGFVQPVDLEGKVTGRYPFAGRFVKEPDPLILDELRSRGLLYRSEKIVHTYPFCWRCETPLVYYAKPSWYIRTTALKDKLISGNKEINWYPDYIKHGRFGDWLENNVDWAFSRERYWGTPLNVWRCSLCESYECVGGLDELRAWPNLDGLGKDSDLHCPHMDEVTFACAKWAKA